MEESVRFAMPYTRKQSQDSPWPSWLCMVVQNQPWPTPQRIDLPIAVAYRPEAPTDHRPIASANPQIAEQHTQAIDIVAVVGPTRCQLLRGGIARRTRCLLQPTIAVGVSQSKIDDFQLMAIACDHDVGRLQITVNHLCPVNIVNSIEQLPRQASPFF